MKYLLLLFSVMLSASAEVKSISEYSEKNSLVQKVSGNEIHFRDDETFLILSKLKTYLIKPEGQTKLVIDIAVQGPLIDPTPGFEEKQGFNQLASDNLEKIRCGVAPFTIIDRNNKTVEYEVRYLYGHTSKRKLKGDKIIMDSLSPKTILRVAFVANVNHLHDSIKLVFNESMRLKVDLSSQPLFKEALTQFSKAVTTQTAEKQEALSVNLEQWKKRDLRSKWNLVYKSLGNSRTLLNEWISFLKKHKEYDLIEKLILTNSGGFDLGAMGKFLADEDAPNWPRVIAHTEENASSHMKVGVNKAIEGKDHIYFSFRKDNQLPLNEKLKFKRVKTDKYKPYKSLYDSLQLLKKKDFLSLPSESLIADKNKIYLFELKTAIDLLATLKNTREYREDLKNLVFSEKNGIAIYAMLAYTKSVSLPIPLELKEIILNKGTNPDRAAAALMAFSYLPNNQAFLLLHNILLEDNHPAWEVAVSRLGDMGNAFTLDLVDKMKNKDKLEKMTQKIEQRLSTLDINTKDKKIAMQLSYLQQPISLALCAYSLDEKNTLAVKYKEWLKSYIRSIPSDVVSQVLKNIEGTSLVSYSEKQNEAFKKLITELRLHLKN